MHTVHSFVIRLFVDTNSPAQLRGAIQSPLEPIPVPFNDEHSLIEILQRLIQANLSSTVSETRSSIESNGGCNE